MIKLSFIISIAGAIILSLLSVVFSYIAIIQDSAVPFGHLAGLNMVVVVVLGVIGAGIGSWLSNHPDYKAKKISR